MITTNLRRVNIPEERRPQQNRGGSLKSRNNMPVSLNGLPLIRKST